MAIADADVLSATAGDETAMARLFEQHNVAMVAFAQRILRDEAAAHDAAQVSWTKIVTHIKEYRGDSAFRTWALAIVRNEARMALRRERLRRGDTSLEEVCGPHGLRVESRRLSVDGKQGQRVAARDVESMLRRLPEGWREVVELAYIEGLSGQEVAERLGVSLACAKTRLMRSMRSMRTAARVAR